MAELQKPHLDALAGLSDWELETGPRPHEIERRAQELWNAWLLRFFAGQPFTTLGTSGEPVEEQFERCDLLYDQGTPNDPLERPLIHMLLVDKRDGDGRRIPGGFRIYNGRWTWNILVRAPAQLPVDPAARAGQAVAATDPQFVCRRVADQLRWALLSAHVADLSVKGIGHLRIESGPRSIQAGSWIMRQIVLSAQVTYRMNHFEG